ncbi:FAD/NAD(P)-binding domain-containing protein [Polyplosphaeria fusca]|uniref:FAD/NAD(P)-binding domain-containing protein n=1 Tax=Polyplosphaeria fusca TaxID=682080 RepID=A0A9P4V026_9PLEO|nr:FAD/NAD(P)-binding domain-containing protein [Polyplosphaeria fusca]
MSASGPSKPLDLAIVGGGISGLTFAIGLLENGIRPTIYEAAAHFGEIGAGVAFGPNACRAIAKISPKVAAAFDKCKTANTFESKGNTWFDVRIGDERRADKDGYVKPGVKVGDLLYEILFSSNDNRGGVHRARFLDELVKIVPDGVAKFGKKLADISDATDGSGDVVLHFMDGSIAQHTAVVGCDGIKARTREIVLGKDDPAATPVFSGKYAYRGLIPMDEAIKLVGEEEAQNSQFYFGYHGHLLTFPIEKGKTMNVVAFSSAKEWKNPNWVVSTSKEEMQADFAGWGPKVTSIVGAMQKPDIWALFYHLPASTFYKDRICLLGDAAHATTPHQGAGAGMCVEDSLVLSSILKDAKTVDDIKKAFVAFDQVRRPRTLKNVVTSGEAGQLYEFELEGDDLDQIEKNQRERMKWIWDIDLDEQIEQARKIYQGDRAKM